MRTVDYKMSKEIYSRLVTGKMINRFELNGQDERASSAMYAEIADNLEEYSNQYRMCGYELVQGLNFFYVRDYSKDMLKLDITKKVASLLIIIGYFNSKNFSHEKLSNERGGLSSSEIEEIGKDDFVTEALGRIELGKNGLLHAIKTVLVDRGIMWQKSNGNFVLSDAGVSFYNDMISADTNEAS